MSDRVSMTLEPAERDAIDALTFLGYTRQGPPGTRTHDALRWLIFHARRIDPELDAAMTEAIAARDRYQVHEAFDQLVGDLDGGTCRDCGGTHLTVASALACDDQEAADG